MDSTKKALATNNAAMLFYGISAILIGPTLPAMITEFDLNLSQAGLIGSLQNAGGLFGALAAMLLADRLPRPVSILISFLLLSLALIAVGFSQTYAALLLSLAASGFFIRVLDVMLNAHTGALTPGNSGRAMNLLHMFFSIGAFLGPIVTRALAAAGISWAGVYRLIGFGYLVLIAAAGRWLYSYLTRDTADARPAAPPPAAVAESKEPVPAGPAVLLLALLLFFYAVHQVGLSSWLPQFLQSVRGADPDLAGFGLSLYWIGIILGRLITAHLTDKVATGRLLAGGCLLSAFFTAGGALIEAVPLAVVSYGLAGLTSGATIPLAYDFGFRLVPARMGTITAFLAIVMLFGRIGGPWIIGVVAEQSALAVAMLIPAAALALAALLALAAELIRPSTADPLP